MIVTFVLYSPNQPTIPYHMLALKLTVSVVFSPSVRLLSGREALTASCTPDSPLYPLEFKMNRVSFLIDLESIHLHVCKHSDLLNEIQLYSITSASRTFHTGASRWRKLDYADPIFPGFRRDRASAIEFQISVLWLLSLLQRR